MHRDIKPENILIDKGKNLKIADFGVARRIVGNDPYKLQTFSAKGTPFYAAPQVAKHQNYSVLCDIWSAGLVIYEMLTGHYLFKGCTSPFTLKAMQEELKKKPLELAEEFGEFFRQWLPAMLKYEDNDRISSNILVKVFREQLEKLDKEAFETNVQNSNTAEKSSPPRKPIMIIPKTFTQTDNAKNTTHQMNLVQRIKKADNSVGQIVNYFNLFDKRSLEFLALLTPLSKQKLYQTPYLHILLFLQAAIGISSLMEIANMITQEAIRLPNGKTYQIQDLRQSSQFTRAQFTKQYWLDKMRKRCLQLQPMISQIAKAIQIYRYQFPNFFQIFDSIQEFQNQTIRNLSFYQENYRNFFMAYCRQDPSQFSGESLKCYYLVVGMTKINQFMNIDQQGASQNIISMVKEQTDRNTLLGVIAQYQE